MGFEIRVLATVLAVALQVQATLPIGESGVRAAVSDLFLPIALIYTGLWLLTSPTRLSWRIPGVWWWLIAISVALTISLIVGRQNLGEWSLWALLNKWAGWFALACYFVIGGAIVRAGGMELRTEFVHTFLIAAAVISLVNVVAFPWLLPHYSLPFGIEFNRATGGMQNSNAFGFLLAVASLLVLATQYRLAVVLPPLLTALWFTSSRGALIAFACGLVALLILHRPPLRKIATTIGVTIAAIVAITAISVVVEPAQIARAQSGSAPIGFLSSERLDPEADTIQKRQSQYERAITFFRQAPVFGNGLGYFLEKTGVTLHNSLLWLLIETGLVGTVAMTGFLLTAVYYLYRGRKDPFLLGVFAVSIAFMVMSATGEFLYQRHLWLLLGMALALPPTHRISVR